MRKAAKIVSWLSLVGVISPSFVYLYGKTSLPELKVWMLIFSALWFGSVPFWMDRKEEK